jgi:hypothetical protein
MHPTTPEPVRAASSIRTLFEDAGTAMSAYWFAVDGSWEREEYARALAAELAGLPIVPLIIRDERFDNPNAIMVELIHILNRNRQRCLDVLDVEGAGDDRFAIVLLARTELGVTQSSSPVVLPDWVPRVGGRSVFCYIHDMSWRIEVPLNADGIGLPELHRRLYTLEQALLRQLLRVKAYLPDRQRDLFDAVGRRRDAGWTGLLSAASAALDAENHPEAYRPSARDGRSLVSRLWEVASNRSKDDVIACARALAAALALPAEAAANWCPSMTTVVSGRVAVADDAGARFALDVMTTVAGACHLITSAAHAGEHKHYPEALLRLLIHDMCRSLGDIERTITGLDAVWQPVVGRIDEEAVHARI